MRGDGALQFLLEQQNHQDKCKSRLLLYLAVGFSVMFFLRKMLYGYDLLDGFSSVEKLCWDDVFAESVLGSQRNKEELDRFA